MMVELAPAVPTATTVDPLACTASSAFPVGLVGVVHVIPPSVLRRMEPLFPTATIVVAVTKTISFISLGVNEPVTGAQVTPPSELRNVAPASPTAIATVEERKTTSIKSAPGSFETVAGFHDTPLSVLRMMVDVVGFVLFPTATTVVPSKATAFRSCATPLVTTTHVTPPSVLRIMTPPVPTPMAVVALRKTRSAISSFVRLTPEAVIVHESPLFVLRSAVPLFPTATAVVEVMKAAAFRFCVVPLVGLSHCA